MEEPMKKVVHRHLVQATDQILFFLEPSSRGALFSFIHLYGFTAVILGVALWGGRRTLLFSLCIGLLVLLQFFLLEGCILTRLEQHYSNHKETVVDIFLELFGIPVSRDTQKTITIIGYTLIVVAFLIMYLRQYILKTQ
jgi:hypothetical protein